METLLVTPNNETDLKLIKIFLKGLNISPKTLSDDEKEDFVMGETMNNIDRTEKVSSEDVMSFLKS